MAEPNYWERLKRSRISRRKLLVAGAAGALGAAAAAVIARSGSGGAKWTRTSATPHPESPEGAIPGGTLTIGRPLPVLGLDPHIDITGLDILPLLYSYLYSWRPSTEEAVFNNLAESVEIPSPDQTEFIFKLRSGVKFRPFRDNPPGTELISEDVRQSFIRRSTRATAIDKRFPLRISGSETTAYWDSHAEALRAAFRAPDPYTFSIKMSERFVPAFREMANPTWAILPSEVADPPGSDHGGLGQTSLGSGPYMVKEFFVEESHSQRRITLKRHEEYFLAPRPWLNEMRYRFITDPTKLLEAFDSREVDATVLQNRAEAEDRVNDDIIINKVPARSYPVIHITPRERDDVKNEFEDRRVWEAFDLALDRDEMIERIWDGDAKYNGPVPWHLDGFSLRQEELRAAMPHDPERAKRLLAEAGYENGFEVHMQLPKMPGLPVMGQLAALIKEQVGRIGIELVPEEQELGTFIGNTLLSGRFDLALFPQLPYDEPDRPLSFYHPRGVTGGLSWNYYSRPDFKDVINAEIQELIDAQADDFNAESRIDTILKVQHLILKEHGPQLTLPSGYAFNAHWKYVHNPFPLLSDAGDGEGRLPGVDTWTERAQPSPTAKASP